MSKLNETPKVTDFENSIFPAQQANESTSRHLTGAELAEKLKRDLTINGQRIPAVAPGVLPSGPSGQERYMEVTAVGTWTYGGVEVGSNAEGYRTTFWWTGDSWVDNGSVKVKGDPVDVSNTFGQQTDVAISEKKFTDEVTNTVDVNESVPSYGLGKIYTFASGTTGFQQRVGVTLPANFNSKKIRIRIEATSNISCQLFWQKNITGTPNVITPFFITWSGTTGAYYYDTEIEASDVSTSTNLFLFIQNNTTLTNDVTLSWESISYTSTLKNDVLKNANDISSVNSSVNSLNNELGLLEVNVVTLNESLDSINSVLESDDEDIDIKTLADKQSVTIPEDSITSHRIDWALTSASLLKKNDVIHVQFLSQNGANQPYNRFYKYSNTKIADIVWTYDEDEEVYKSQEFEVTITQSDIDTYPTFRLIMQTNNASGLDADVISINYSFIRRTGQYIDVKYIESKVNEYSNAFDLPYSNYNSMTPIIVKKTGGQFATIQDAINSITDASSFNQYDIQVWDDYTITDLTDLYKVNTPSSKNTSATAPSEMIALVITKPYVHIRGMGAMRKLSIISPTALHANSFQYVQTIFPKGTCIIDNFYVSIKGGRYAIHQESGGAVDHPDFFATTIYRNLFAEHLGNRTEDGYNSAWTAVWAQANGTSAGSREIYENVIWKTIGQIPFYVHTNKDLVQGGNEFVFKNCSAYGGSEFNLSQFSLHLQDLGSGKKNKVTIEGCNFNKFNIQNEIRGNEQVMTPADLWENGGAYLLGQNNVPMLANVVAPTVMKLSSINNNHDIEVIGGTAKDLIFGSAMRIFKSSANAKGETWGSKRTVAGTSGNTQIFSLPYRLGNCATVNKTLVVKVNGTEYTVTFDKNYMTESGGSYSWNTTPFISQAGIVAEINAAYPTIFRLDIGFGFEMYSFSDCTVNAFNGTSTTIDRFKFLVRDYTQNNGWKLSQTGDKIEAISSNRIDISKSDKALLVNKILIPTNRVGLTGVTAGSYFKAGPNGNLIAATSSDGQFVAIDTETLKCL